ncbi:MAG: hypothetical protein QOE70_5787 [Chthoniobacter sp.]|jgi:hypothetical protein|nr:hypothetical protein [Chthoniobacter sp.]
MRRQERPGINFCDAPLGLRNQSASIVLRRPPRQKSSPRNRRLPPQRRHPRRSPGSAWTTVNGRPTDGTMATAFTASRATRRARSWARLYFVDTPEAEATYRDRLDEQAAYFGNTRAKANRHCPRGGCLHGEAAGGAHSLSDALEGSLGAFCARAGVLRRHRARAAKRASGPAHLRVHPQPSWRPRLAALPWSSRTRTFAVSQLVAACR